MAISRATDIVIRDLTESDASAILDIYQQGIDTGHATFQEYAPNWDEWDQSHLKMPRLGAFADGELTGWAVLSATSSRRVYAGVAEESVYVGTRFSGLGVGRKLLHAIISASEEAGVWTLTAGIFPENVASLKLHEAAGFKILGRRERIGKMTFGPLTGQWRDVLSLERRSEAPQFT